MWLCACRRPPFKGLMKILLYFDYGIARSWTSKNWSVFDLDLVQSDVWHCSGNSQSLCFDQLEHIFAAFRSKRAWRQTGEENGHIAPNILSISRPFLLRRKCAKKRWQRLCTEVLPPPALPWQNCINNLNRFDRRTCILVLTTSKGVDRLAAGNPARNPQSNVLLREITPLPSR